MSPAPAGPGDAGAGAAGPPPWEPPPGEPPVVDRRFAADAQAHRRDAPRYCPRCAAELGLATEFWEGADRRFYCWCGGCGWTGEVTSTGSGVTGHEPEH